VSGARGRARVGRTGARFGPMCVAWAGVMRVAWPGACVALVLAAVALAGCAGVKPPDLFVVERSGPGGRLTLLVDEQGGLRCNGARARALSDPQLIQARAIQEELSTPSSVHLSLPPRPGSVFAYRVRDEAGSVSFADNSAAQPKVLHNLALFVLQVAQQNCHLP
jgi:hypothetical protein